MGPAQSFSGGPPKFAVKYAALPMPLARATLPVLSTAVGRRRSEDHCAACLRAVLIPGDSGFGSISIILSTDYLTRVESTSDPSSGHDF